MVVKINFIFMNESIWIYLKHINWLKNSIQNFNYHLSLCLLAWSSHSGDNWFLSQLQAIQKGFWFYTLFYHFEKTPRNNSRCINPNKWIEVHRTVLLYIRNYKFIIIIVIVCLYFFMGFYFFCKISAV